MAFEEVLAGMGKELQTAMMEHQGDKDFRIGEMPESNNEDRELLKEDADATAADFRKEIEIDKDLSKEYGPEAREQAPEVPNQGETELTEATDKDKEAEFTKAKEEYLQDVKERSPCPETIDDKKIENAEFKARTSDETAVERKDFNEKKADLIKQWENEHGREWPRYTEDVYYNGVKIRSKGDLYDCHHLQPLGQGGKNEVSNITPLHALDHFDKQGIHAKDSPYSHMEQLLKNKEVV